jgi:hypothetical protein
MLSLGVGNYAIRRFMEHRRQAARSRSRRTTPSLARAQASLSLSPLEGAPIDLASPPVSSRGRSRSTTMAYVEPRGLWPSGPVRLP